MKTKKNIVNIPVEIPEGYELDGELKLVENFEPTYWRGEKASIYRPCLYALLKKKEVKDFNWYIDLYIESSIFNEEMHSWHFEKLKENKYIDVCFEIKIGLLKFICDDLNIDILYYLRKDFIDNSDEIVKIFNICPGKFLDSIFNDKK